MERGLINQRTDGARAQTARHTHRLWSAARMAPCAKRPVATSMSATPVLAGGPSSEPVMLMRPYIPGTVHAMHMSAIRIVSGGSLDRRLSLTLPYPTLYDHVIARPRGGGPVAAEARDAVYVRRYELCVRSID